MDGLRVELRAGVPEHTAGQPLLGTVHLPPRWQRPGLTMVITLRWWTEGKGEEESGAFPFRVPVPANPVPAAIPFELQLPERPWSYEGRILKIRWALHVAVHLQQQSTSAELPLVLCSPFLRSKLGPYRG